MRISTAVSLLLSVAMLGLLGCSASEADQARELIQSCGGSFNSDSQGHVTSVNLSNSQANDDVIAAIASLPEVQTLNCTNALGIKGTTLDSLAALPKIETLYLVGTGLTDEGVARLHGLKSLKTLHLGRTAITDAGMPGLDGLTSLQTLSLGNTAVTDAGLVQLRDLRQLSTLILKETKTTKLGAQELHRMLPELRIEQ